jgi:hypothetical protein
MRRRFLMKRTGIQLLLAAFLCLSPLAAHAFELSHSIRGGAASSYSAGDLVVVDVFLDADPGLVYFDIFVDTEVAVLAYDPSASASLPVIYPAPSPLYGTNGSRPGYILYAAPVLLYPLGFTPPLWPAPPVGHQQVQVGFSSPGLTPTTAAGADIWIASLAFGVHADFVSTDIELTFDLSGEMFVENHDISSSVPLSGPITLSGTLLEGPDSDDDGIVDDLDNCPNVPNDQADNDGDGAGDACDVCPLDPDNDADGDGVCGNEDTCPLGDDSIDSDEDGMPDACDVCPLDVGNDADGDGVCEIDDNCDDVPNSGQADTDMDGTGDACEPDTDDDGVLDDDDNCLFDVNPDQEDADDDGFGDACDVDDDNDGIIDAVDACIDTAPGSVVLDDGCSIEQTCPCENPWKNRGAFMTCTVDAVNVLRAGGRISEIEVVDVIGGAGGSGCGQNP